MSDENKGSLAYRQEVLPALGHSVSSVPDVSQLPQGLFGTALFARARYASERKQIEAYSRLVRAKNELLGLLKTQFDLAISFAAASERASQMETYRQIGRTQADLELGQIEDQLATLRERRELTNLAYEEQKLHSQMRIKRAERELEQLRAEPAPQPPPTSPLTTADKIREVGRQIDEVEHAYTQERERMIRAAGGDEKLSDDARRRLGQFEMVKEKLLHDVLAGLG